MTSLSGHGKPELIVPALHPGMAVTSFNDCRVQIYQIILQNLQGAKTGIICYTFYGLIDVYE